MTALVLLHAFPLSAAMWDGVRAGLGPDVDVLAPELPGSPHRQPPDGPPSLDAVADRLADDLDRAGVDRAVLCGLSMGGYVAMAFLRRHPQRVAGLVLADTKATADPEPARANRERIAATVLAEQSPRVLVDDVLPALLSPVTWDERSEVAARVRTLVEAADLAGVAWAQRAMAARPDSLDTLRTVTVPSAVVVGADDTLSPVADAEAMAAALPDARVVVLPRTGHLSAVEDPEPFAAAVRDLVERVSA